MLYLYVTIQTLLHSVGDHLNDRRNAIRDNDRGSVTLEQVIVTGGLFVVAGLVVAGITVAVNNHLTPIK